MLKMLNAFKSLGNLTLPELQAMLAAVGIQVEITPGSLSEVGAFSESDGTGDLLAIRGRIKGGKKIFALVRFFD